MKITAIVLVTAFIACGGAAAPGRTGVASSVESPSAKFDNYRTFSFGPADRPKEGYSTTARSLEVQSRLKTVVLNALVARGYKEDASKGDFVVKLATGTGDAPNPSAEHAASTPAVGYIGVDIYDAPSGTMILEGSAFAEIDLDKIDDSLLQRGVEHMLAALPTAHQAGSP